MGTHELEKGLKDIGSGLGKIGGGIFKGVLTVGAGVGEVVQGTVDNIKESAQKTTEEKALRKNEELRAGELNNSFVSDMNATADTGKNEIGNISVKNAMKILYYLMAVDGTIFHNEEEKYELMCKELDPNYQTVKDEIVAECKNQIDKGIDKEDFYEVIQEGVDAAISSMTMFWETSINPKLLVWNMLTVAYSDENYDVAERKLIKFVVRKTGIDQAIFLELESSILTLIDIEKELAWIKTTDRPYMIIEMMVNELADRKNVVFESVKELITL